MRDCPPGRGRRGPAGSRAIDGGSGVEGNGSRSGGYRSVYAQTGQGTALGGPRRTTRRACVLERLSSRLPATWPKGGGGDLLREYLRLRRPGTHAWRRYLPRAAAGAGARGAARPPSIAHRRPVAERPAAAADRQRFGHWEGMLFGEERRSRLLLMMRARSKAAGPIAETIARVLEPLPPAFRQTVTRRQRASSRQDLHRDLLLDTYAVAEGGSRNAIGRLRRFLPRKMNLAEGRRSGLRKWRWRTTIRRVSASARGRDGVLHPRSRE